MKVILENIKTGDIFTKRVNWGVNKREGHTIVEGLRRSRPPMRQRVAKKKLARKAAFVYVITRINSHHMCKVLARLMG